MPYLKLLGGALVEGEAGPRRGPVARRHPLALLALLATAPARTLSRGKAVGLLWPESSEKRARHRLNTCLYHLRSGLGEGVAATVGDDLRLEEGVLECDVWSFREALAAGDPARAVELYDGPFLDGFELRGSAPFEKWLDRERARLRDRYHGALEALAEAAEERGEPEAAGRWWRERASEDPYDSRVARRLAGALAAGGNRAGALRVVRTHARLLREELGAEPGAEVADLLARLERGDGEAGGSPGRGGGEAPAGSVAVLPFDDVGGSEEAAMLAEGLHGDLLTELSRLPSLTVISRTSVLRYRDAGKSLREIARELGVGAVVEGEVQQAGRRIRLRVQLIDAATDAHLWADRWDRELSAETLFEIQSEITREVVAALEGELGTAGRDRLGDRPTGDLEAYRLYVSGRAHLEQRTKAGMERAVELFRGAIDRDGAYAAAWAGLAEALGLLASYRHVRSEASLDEAEEAARRAVELRPGLAEGHAAAGLVHMVRRRGPRALAALRRAARLRPGDARTRTALALALGPLGHWTEGARHLERACRLDPMSPEIHFCMAERYTLEEGPTGEHLAHARRARELSPGYAEAYLLEGRILTAAGRPEEGVAAVRKGLELASAPTRPRHLAALVHAHAEAGRGAEARKALAELAEAGEPFFEGVAHAALGDREAAFERFGRADWPSLHSFHLRYDPALEPLRGDPRYRALLREVNRRWGLRPDGSVPEVAASG